jgi:hypothetical protein
VYALKEEVTEFIKAREKKRIGLGTIIVELKITM